ncbi:tetratricopeptide repeat-containing diguanylate cyclase [Deefgea piscis]|uniref:tetratricopeptide repeat-containing diguanylate cyclase n=1 Tax=Deefgea piscis TaxID=2739061 RepID=UPI001C80FFEF|nr:GGDEF domain-containing protein [Deefgea piscis]QZA81054.1 diguanylate cyclase [Deefgea piscis]
MDSLVLGRTLLQQGQSHQALQHFLDGLAHAQSEQSNEAGYWLAIADIVHDSGQFERALSLHQHALSLAEGEAHYCSAYLGLAADLWAMGQVAAAYPLQAQALAMAVLQDDAVLLVQSARLYQLQQQWPAALAQFEQAVLLVDDCESFMLHWSILSLYLQINQTDGLPAAISRASSALAHAGASDLRGALLIKLAQASQACQQYTAAVDFYQAAMLHSAQQKKPPRPRRLREVEFKLQQTTSEIEIDLLRLKSAQQDEQVRLLESTTYRDAVTGLHNLRYLEARWPMLLALAIDHPSLCVLHCGVDQSTYLREVMGEAKSNDCSLRIAKVLQDALPEGAELIAGGQLVFKLMLPASSADLANALIEQIQQQIAQLDFSDLPEALTLSMGGTIYQQGDTVDVLQLRADLALYLAMRHGAGAVVWEMAV